MLDHMSSSGVMHEDGRRCGVEIVKHERKTNIAAVHMWYRNTDIFPLLWNTTSNSSTNQVLPIVQMHSQDPLVWMRDPKTIKT